MNRRVVSSKGVHLVIWVRQKVRLILVKNQVNQFEYHFEMIYTEYTAVTLNHCNFNKLFRKLSLNNYN